ncbi:MAG: hypothetical protein ACLFWL_14740 [Candidatus Brocadiia bacterium]
MRKIWLLVAIWLSCSFGFAAGKSWELRGYQALVKGKLDGVSLLSTGELRLAPSIKKINGLEANYVWDIAPGDDSMWVAAGSPGAVYRLKGDKAELVHKTSEDHVQSMLVLDDGVVLAGTAPRGMIYRITEAGEVTIFSDLGATYVWDMCRGPGGEIVCATGPEGALIQLNNEGESSEIFKAKQKNLLSVVRSGKGSFYVGTQPDGLVYNVKMDGSVTVVYDAEEEEIRTLARGQDGALYIGTAQAKGPNPNTPKKPGKSSAPKAPSSGEGPSAQVLPGKPASDNSIYRMIPGEGAVRLASFQQALVLSMAFSSNQELMAGTGVEGRLVGVNRKGVMRVVGDFQARHISAMAVDTEGAVIIGTSNGGGLWRLGKELRETGTFASSVHDAGYLSAWSRISWRGDCPDSAAWEVELRTGNSRKPDKTWSEWSMPVRKNTGQPLNLPMGRFAQIKLTLSTAGEAESPEVLAIETSYRQTNRRPQIQKLQVNGQRQGGGSDQQKSGSGSSKSKNNRGTRTISWQGNDPNGDELVFELQYKATDEREWKVLKEDIRGKTNFQWETGRVPDGTYLVRLIASDRLARPPAEALEGERMTAPFVVDNRRPAVEQLKQTRQTDGAYRISGLARDKYSAISRMEVSHNSQKWQPVFAADRMFDSPAEKFVFETEKLESGEHVFVFVATDVAGNTGSGKIVVEVE